MTHVLNIWMTQVHIILMTLLIKLKKMSLICQLPSLPFLPKTLKIHLPTRIFLCKLFHKICVCDLDREKRFRWISLTGLRIRYKFTILQDKTFFIFDLPFRFCTPFSDYKVENSNYCDDFMKNYNVALSEEQIKTRKLHGSSLLNLMKYYRKNSEFMRPFVKNGMTTLLGNYILGVYVYEQYGTSESQTYFHIMNLRTNYCIIYVEWNKF